MPGRLEHFDSCKNLSSTTCNFVPTFRAFVPRRFSDPFYVPQSQRQEGPRALPPPLKVVLAPVEACQNHLGTRVQNIGTNSIESPPRLLAAAVSTTQLADFQGALSVMVSMGEFWLVVSLLGSLVWKGARFLN